MCKTGRIRDDVSSWEKMMFLYNSAMKEVVTKMEIIQDEYQLNYKYNPIEYIESRLKSAESIVNKLRKNGYEPNMENMAEHLNDIAGVRIVCSFTADIYRIAELIGQQDNITVIYIKDYMKNPKKSGYRSYHMLVSVPVYTRDGVVPTKVEIQIRTIAMDFWASLEHKIYYKYEGHAPEHISKELVVCSDIIAELDAKMLSLNEEVMALDQDDIEE